VYLIYNIYWYCNNEPASILIQLGLLRSGMVMFPLLFIGSGDMIVVLLILLRAIVVIDKGRIHHVNPFHCLSFTLQWTKKLLSLFI
jgi:hypothetical protein